MFKNYTLNQKQTKAQITILNHPQHENHYTKRNKMDDKRSSHILRFWILNQVKTFIILAVLRRSI